MNDDNTRKLFKRFRFLNKKNMPDGFQCEDGWYSLVYNMCKAIKETNPPHDFFITHVGEKYNKLQVHSKNGNLKTRVAISEFVEQSEELCDRCGKDRDLESCDKCTVPVINYDDDEEEDTDEDDGSCNSCTGTCGC